MQQGGRPLLGPLAPHVVAGRGLDARVQYQLVRRREAGSRVEQVSDESAPHVVGCEAFGLYLPTQPAEDVLAGLLAHAPPL